MQVMIYDLSWVLIPPGANSSQQVDVSKKIYFFIWSIFVHGFLSFRMDGLCRRIYNLNESTGPMVNNDIETECEYGFLLHNSFCTYFYRWLSFWQWLYFNNDQVL